MTQIHVIIPVYNALTYLRETVDSVLSQPYQGIDIVLVDDGSTDGSAALCDQIANETERVSVIHQVNQGVSAARNAGIDHVLEKGISTGYIAFLDSDDLWVRGVVTTELIEADVHADVIEFGCVNSNFDCSKFSVSQIYDAGIKNGGEGVIWPMVGTFCANFYGVLLLKKWGIRFIEGLKYSEDKIFRMQCVFLANQVQYMPQILHIYRENPGSAMRKIFAYTPIEYYVPIIDGWISSDSFVNNWESVSGKHLDAGETLAGIYFGDMIVEHFKRWHSAKKIQAVCQQHPYYHLYTHMNPKAVSVKQYRNKQMYMRYPLIFRIKYGLIGAAEYIARLALRFKPIYDLRQRRKYPLSAVPK